MTYQQVLARHRKCEHVTDRIAHIGGAFVDEPSSTQVRDALRKGRAIGGDMYERDGVEAVACRSPMRVGEDVHNVGKSRWQVFGLNANEKYLPGIHKATYEDSRKKGREIHAGGLAEALQNPKATVSLTLDEGNDLDEFKAACPELSELRELEIYHPDLTRLPKQIAALRRLELLTAIHVGEEVCFSVAHRQIVLTLGGLLKHYERRPRTWLPRNRTLSRG